ncbi:MAG: hypothetical protein AB1726_17060, partial [Planctomycetota bacterium]
APPSSPPRRRRRLGRRGAALAISLAAAYGLLEVVLHRVPRLLPLDYRESYPLGGIEFYRPGILDQTPLDALPPPVINAPWEGPLPSDLIARGVVPADVDEDRRCYPHVIAPADEMGFPNLARPDRADVVLVGDSFLVSAGLAEPPGLAAQLAQRTARTVYNLGVSGCGPVHELHYLCEWGLPLEPDLVLWFFFGGNDLLDVYVHLTYTRTGYATWGELFADQRPPRLFVPDLVRFYAARVSRASAEPLSPLRLRTPEGGTRPIWFLGTYLVELSYRRADIERKKVWPATTEVLRRARDIVEGAGARFAVVYLPTKAQVYVPYVEPDAEAIFAMGRRGEHGVPQTSPAQFLADVLANRNAVEDALADFCAAEGISYFSATPALEGLARRGELGFLTADTHWSVDGQAAALDPLLDFLAAEGLLAP